MSSKIIKRRFFILPVLTGFVVAAGCLGLTTSDDSGTSDAGEPTLTEGDFPDLSPCSNRDTLPNDTTFLDVITNATQAIHIHTQYESDDNLPAVCGLSDVDNALESTETGWDPSAGTEVGICYTFADEISAFFALEDNPGICRSNYALETENTAADGFPRAGTYRLDACIEDGGNSYDVRVRAVVSGTDVNKTLTQAGVKDLESLEVYDNDGTVVTTTEQAKKLFTDNPNGFIFTIRSSDGTTTHISVTVQVICVKHRSSACPTPTEACS